MQTYEVNPDPSKDSHFGSRDVSDDRMWERSVNEPSKQEYDASSEADVDPWDIIQNEKEREKW